ncbi:serine hydrolase [Fodinicola feengrottensis]|uniref:serine hydrolase n=1 Tax=Fodinicola feengrottensis TaxID=435914 RepID=UPI0031D31E30
MDGPGEVAVGADDLVVSASVAKTPVALEVFRQISGGKLDPTERVRLSPTSNTAGPTGFSNFADDVEVSVRDLARMMMVISDNAATDVLIDKVGLDSIHATLTSLGLTRTIIPTTLRDMLDSVGTDAGFADWKELVNASADPHVDELVSRSRAMRPATAMRTTASEAATLVSLIWRDEAGPPQACAQVRQLMATQLTRHRLAMGFPRPVRVSAKSGGLLGVVRNEAGVIQFPDGSRYAAAVFTRALTHPANDSHINTAIGLAAANAVATLRT